jgi:hypothetical protein
MQTSGASTESRMTITIILIAVGLLVILAGGPSDFLKVVDRVLQTGFQACLKVYQGLRG